MNPAVWPATRFAFMMIVATVLGVSLVNAEQSEPRPQSPGVPPVVQPKLMIRAEDLFPLTPPTRLGVFTLTPPRSNGEVIRIAIPVGQLAMKGARAAAGARRRRLERKVEQRIESEIRQLSNRHDDTPK